MGLDETDYLRGRLARTGRRADIALERVREWMAPGFVTWSGGKDSTAVVDLVRQVDSDYPIVHFDSGMNFPEVESYIDDLADEWDLNLFRVSVGNVLDDMIANGSWDYQAEDRESVFFELLIAGPAAVSRDKFGDALWWGLRASESLNRRMTLSTSGEKGRRLRKDGVTTLSPIWDWQTSDVRGYLARRGVPLCPIYAKLEALGVPEVNQRVDIVVGSDGIDQGRLAWLKRGWPELYRHYETLLPRMREVSS